MYRKLRGRIIEKYGSLGAFAIAVGFCRQSISNYVNGKTGFTAEIMDRWAKALDIERSEYAEYFFA